MYDDADIYRELAPLLRVRPELQQLCAFGGRWESYHEPERERWAPFHIVTHGECLLDAGGEVGIHLRAGDIAVLPHGGPHMIRGLPSATNAAAPVQKQRRLPDELLIKSNIVGEPDTKLICGRCCFEHAHDNMVLAALPALVVLIPDKARDGERLRGITIAMCNELEDDRLGSAIVATSLASSLMLLVLRAHFEATPAKGGIFALLARPQTARVLAAMLANPEQGWTLGALAGVAATSRATLVRFFKKAVDAPPLAYLAELRLGLARYRIMSSNTALVAIAEDVGYQSESSFSRAYHRRFGVAPGAHRTVRGSGSVIGDGH